MQDKLYNLAERINQLKDQIKTEEATKQSFILPFFQILGYDVFNPLEFCPEFTADVGIKKGEKVDYVILQENKPFILIEAKGCFEALEKHDSQLYRYYATTDSRFAILTNGIIYRFYADLDSPNKMDTLPFFELNMLELTDSSIKYLEKFIKQNLDVNTILSTASDLKYLNLSKNYFKELVENPSDDFIKMMISGIYEGTKTQAIIDKFKPIVKKGIASYINDTMSSRFKETLNQSATTEEITKEDNIEESKINTTVEEMNAYAIVKSIVRKTISAKRLTFKDTESYFSVFIDNNTRKWLCRLIVGKKNNYLIVPDENKKDIRLSLDEIDDIYNYENELIEVVNRYL